MIYHATSLHLKGCPLLLGHPLQCNVRANPFPLIALVPLSDLDAKRGLPNDRPSFFPHRRQTGKRLT